jgi:hypothetical protein
MKKAILSTLLLLALILPACAEGHEAAILIPEQSIDGHFINTNNLTRLLIHVLPRSLNHEDENLPSPDQYATKQIDSFYISSSEQITVYAISATMDQTKSKYQNIPLTEETERYDNISFDQVCRNPETGLDLVQLSLTVGGTANADILDTLFIHYLPELRRFTSTIISNMFVENCSIQQSLTNLKEHEEQRSAGIKLYEILKPQEELDLPKEFYDPIQLERKSFSTAEINALKNQMASLEQRCYAYAHWEERDQRYFFDQMVENERWEIYALYYYEIWNSWGVLLSHDKQTGRWTCFYTIPAGGSKTLLYLSDYFELDGNNLSLELCTECNWWGRYKEVAINLKDLTLRPISTMGLSKQRRPGYQELEDIYLCRNGECQNLTQFDRRQHIYDFSLSEDKSKIFVWHMAETPRQLSIYNTVTGQLITRFSPGFGGSISWTKKNNIIHTFGCGTGCGMFRLYNSKGTLLRDDVFEAMDYSIDYGFMVTGPLYPRDDTAIRLIDIDSAKVHYDSQNTGINHALKINMLEEVFWFEDEIQVEYQDHHGAIKMLRFNLEGNLIQ